MAGRNRRGRHPENFRDIRDGPPLSLPTRGPEPLPPLHPAALEEELEIRHRDMQRIISENCVIINDNTHLQRDLRAAKDGIHRLGQMIPKLRADKEAQKRELIENKLKLEAQVRAIDSVKKEVVQLRNEVQKLNALRQDLSAQIQSFTKDATRLQAENQQLIPMKADIDALRKQLYEARFEPRFLNKSIVPLLVLPYFSLASDRLSHLLGPKLISSSPQRFLRDIGRRALEFEKKAHEEQAEQKDSMETNLISLAREIENLRAEQLNAVRRAQGLGVGGYGMMNGGADLRYQGSGYGDGYDGSWGHLDKRPRR